MALYDENGSILIDDFAAEQDIARIKNVISLLSDAKNTFNSLLSEAETSKGRTGISIVYKTKKLIKEVDDMINRLNDTSAYISKTVAHYKLLDQQIKDAILAAQNTIGGE